MPRRKTVVLQHRTVADADAGLKAVLQEYRDQLKAKDAETGRLLALYNDSFQQACTLRQKVDVLSKAVAQEVFHEVV